MTQLTTLGLRASGLALCLAGIASAQQPQGEADAKEKKPYAPPPLFSADKPLDVTITAPMRQLRRDRSAETPYRAGTIAYAGPEGMVTLPVRLRTRGIWRKRNCEQPPLMLNFTKDSTKQSEFAKLDRVRLSPHCRDNDGHDQYVLQDYQIYRVQRLLTPYSFDVRLARVTYIDEEKKDTIAQRYGFFQELDGEFADRVGGKLIEVQGAAPDDLDPYESAFLGVFQYFIGNTDFSIRALHNIVLLFTDPLHVPVARDFDWTGAVNARYAKPNEILRIRAVTQRVMRGYCAPPEEYEKVFALFREKKDAIYGLYRDSIGALMKQDVVEETLKYYDDFYKTINDPRAAKRSIVEACLRGSA